MPFSHPGNMNRFSFLRQDLRLQILGIYLLFIGPVVIAGLVFNQQAGRRLRAEIQSADLDLTSVIAQNLEDHLESLSEILSQLSHHSAVIDGDTGRMEEIFRTISIGRSDLSAIYTLDPDCQLGYTYLPGIGPGDMLAEIEFLGQHPLCEGEDFSGPIFSGGHYSQITNQPVVTLGFPVRSPQSGQLIGYAAFDIRLQFLSGLSRRSIEHRPDDEFSVVLTDRQGRILGRSDFDPRSLTSPIGDHILPYDPAVLSWIAEDASGDPSLFSNTRIPLTGWRVIVDRSTSTAFQIPTQFNRGLLFALGVFVLIGFIFWVGLSDRVIQPLQKVATFSMQVAQEDALGQDADQSETLMAVLAARPDQVGHLVRNLVRMEAAIQSRLNELSTLLETSASVVSSLEPPIVLDRILEQVERLLGIEKCAIVALDEVRGVFLSQASRGLSQMYTEQIAVHPSEPMSITMQAIRSGEPVQVGDIETDPRIEQILSRARREGIRSILAVPLKTQYSAPAALLVYRPEPHVFTPREINLVTTFAHQATMAIENATLFARSDTALHEQTRRLEALIQSMQDGLILEDLQGQVRYANRRISEMTGIPPDQITGMPVDMVVDLLLKDVTENETTRRAIESALEQSGSRRVDFGYNGNQGRRFLRLRIFDVTDTDGMLIGRGRILQDITRRYELDRMKSSLISTVSHELRSPLAAIKGYATTLLADDVEWDALSQNEFLRIISHETDRLTGLVNDLLDMSRIEAGNLSISRIRTNLRELVQRAARRAELNPQERLSLEIPPDLQPVFVDPQRMEVVLRNLLDNANKYSPSGERIRVSAEVKEDLLFLRVRDNGFGIPKEARERVFDSFFQVENGLTRAGGGAGLGLAICQGFVRAHGGRIWVEPSLHGTSVVITLPLEGEELVRK